MNKATDLGAMVCFWAVAIAALNLSVWLWLG